MIGPSWAMEGYEQPGFSTFNYVNGYFYDLKTKYL
jgi:hypothetical protein